MECRSMHILNGSNMNSYDVTVQFMLERLALLPRYGTDKLALGHQGHSVREMEATDLTGIFILCLFVTFVCLLQ